ncbi:MAG: DUF4249 domain-containing protein [Breznakibacter sp.]
MKPVYSYLGQLVIAALAFAAWGCTEDIDLKLNTTYKRLVVDGVITSDTVVQSVKLTFSGDYYDNKPSQGVSGAMVTIRGNGESVLFGESNETPGLYLTPDKFYGIPGVTYSLTIENVDVDGDGQPETYEASSTMPQIVPIDSVGIGYHKIWKLWQVLLYARDPGDMENYYMFRVFRNDSLISDSFSEVSLGDDSFFDGNYANGTWVYALDAEESAEDLAVGDEVKLEMYNIDKTFYEFLTALQEETSPKNPLFSGAPANVPGNISNGALGIFAVCGISREKTTLTEDLKK